jgi:hypothetical protein
VDERNCGRGVADKGCKTHRNATASTAACREPIKIERIETAKVVTIQADPTLSSAQIEIAGLLAAAYRRLSAIRCLTGNLPEPSGNNDLANACPQSVHGVVE